MSSRMWPSGYNVAGTPICQSVQYSGGETASRLLHESNSEPASACIPHEFTVFVFIEVVVV